MLQKSTELKRKIHKSTIIVEEFYTTLLIANETPKQKSWKTEDLSSTVYHLHVMGVYRTLPPADFMFFLGAHGIFTKGDKTSLRENKVKSRRAYSLSTMEVN